MKRFDFSAQSTWVRGALIGAVAIGVTIGGVMAGALVVAPVVAKATSPEASSRFDQAIASSSAAVKTGMTTLRASAMTVISRLPEPAARFAVPGLAVISVVSGLSAVFLRRRTPTRSLIPATADISLPDIGNVRLSGRSTAKSRTPRAVEALAASGASTTDIARRTGLPIDAIQLLLAISTGSRQLQPPTA